MKEHDIAHEMLKVLDREFDEAGGPVNVSAVIAHIIFHFLIEAPDKSLIRMALANLISDVDLALVEEMWDQKNGKGNDGGEIRVIH